MKKEIAITPNQIKQSINDLLDEVEYWQKQSTEANNKIDKAIEIYENKETINYKKKKFLGSKNTSDLMYEALKGDDKE